MEKEKKSLSMHLGLNGTDTRQKDENGQLLNCPRIGEDKKTIYRFIDGMLDGDVFSPTGKLVTVKPAIEAPGGHEEYWRQNKLHRDNHEPAILSKGFTHKEWWENGIRQPDREQSIEQNKKVTKSKEQEKSIGR